MTFKRFNEKRHANHTTKDGVCPCRLDQDGSWVKQEYTFMQCDDLINDKRPLIGQYREPELRIFFSQNLKKHEWAGTCGLRLF